MKTIGSWTLIFPLIIVYIDCATLSNVVNIACKRNPYLRLCSSLKTKPSSSAEDFPDSEPPLLPPTDFSKENAFPKSTVTDDGSDFPDFKAKLSKNINKGDRIAEKIEETDELEFPDFKQKSKSFPPGDSSKKEEDEEDSGRPTATTWHNKNGEEPDTVLTRGGNFVQTNEEDAKTRIEAYCEKYQENFDFYCQDSVDKTPTLKTHLLKFCPSFEANCPEKAKKKKKIPLLETTAVPIQSPESAAGNIEEFPDVLNIVKSPEQIAAEERLAKLKKRFPCKPDCNQKIHKHCTTECKCDYIYPTVQRFCNPPPIPFFLNTCRLWYYGCPKYS
uniref:Uncharacterized protein n=1 Tax=Panagrolaimus sp. ES5 TaxID=591445 RepID=A0AC34G8V7_9BILA